jgi:ethanolamine-phosphate cytidylyltransferase
VPKELGIFQKVESGSDLTTKTIVERVLGRRELYEARNARKEKKELDFITSELSNNNNAAV